MKIFRNLIQDSRYALRQLRRAPGFTITALLTMTLAVGATAAMVSVLRATLLNPTPYADAQRLVLIGDTNLKGYKANGLMTVARTGDLAQATVTQRGRETKLLASSAFFYFDQPALVVDGHAPVAVSSVAASGEFFKVLGTQPMLGRVFTLADDTQGAPAVAVLSYALWQRMFGGDAGVIGKAVMLGGKPATVVGVMPRHFDYPGETELWQPGHISLQQFAGYRGANSRFVNEIARLHDGVSMQEARSGLQLLAGRLGKGYPETDAEWGFSLKNLRSEILGSYDEGLLLLSSAVAMLLLIACANIAGLQLARNAKREPEMALRRALGVTPGRLLQQLLTESTLLMVAGSVLGAGLCMLLLRIVGKSLPPVLLRFESPRVDLVTLMVTIAVGVGAGVLCGVAPALQFRRGTGSEVVAPVVSRGVVHRNRRYDRIFAALQIGLALVLVTLASSVMSNLYRLLHVRLGYEPEHVLTASVHLPFGTEPIKAHRFHQQLEQGFAGLPGVQSVGAIDALPLTQFESPWNSDLAGRPLTPHHDAVTAETRRMTPNYLATMQIPLLAGRSFTDRDSDPQASRVVMVNRSFAERYFGNGQAVGAHLVRSTGRAEMSSAEIVGVTADVRGTNASLAQTPGPEVYEPESGSWVDMHFVLRTSEPPAAMEQAMRRQLATIDPGAALGPVELLDGSVNRALTQPRLDTGLLSGLAALAMILALIGIYGVLAFSVTQRTREIGVRIALGSERGAILGMMLRESAAILAGGLALGIGGALLATRLLAAVVSGLETPVEQTLATSSALMVLVVLAASLIPARRAALIDPMEALRSE